jgi:hypothetical protein
METPTTPPPKDPRAVAAERLDERRARVNRIRKRVTAGAVALFIVMFGGLYVQLSSGNDPSLASQAATSTNSTSGTASTQSTAATSTPSAVTTGQS